VVSIVRHCQGVAAPGGGGLMRSFPGSTKSLHQPPISLPTIASLTAAHQNCGIRPRLEQTVRHLQPFSGKRRGLGTVTRVEVRERAPGLSTSDLEAIASAIRGSSQYQQYGRVPELQNSTQQPATLLGCVRVLRQTCAHKAGDFSADSESYSIRSGSYSSVCPSRNMRRPRACSAFCRQ
jgi:hypothetical protein